MVSFASVAILATAPVQEIKHLLELFPIDNIRDKWPHLKGNKAEISKAIAEARDVAAISKFLNDNLSCCKQHVYIFSHEEDVHLPSSLPSGEQLLSTPGVQSTYLVRVRYRVYLSNPLEEKTLDFLWPVRIDLLPKHLVVRFVVLERDIGTYFDREYQLGGRSIDEDDILACLAASGHLSPTDLHKGIKKLWADDFMDCHRAKYKKPISVASEAMDREKGIKKNNPELYKVLRKSTLLNAVFHVSPDGATPCTVSAFSTEPPVGFVGFTRYTEKREDTDLVIGKILESN